MIVYFKNQLKDILAEAKGAENGWLLPNLIFWSNYIQEGMRGRFELLKMRINFQTPK